MSRTTRLVQGVSAVIIAYGLWILSRGYLGIVHDARIYMGQAIAALDNSGVGRDPIFTFGEQSKFTFYGALTVPLVRIFGLDLAAKALSFFGISIWFLGALRLLTATTTWRLSILGLIWASFAPAYYGANAIFSFGESFTTPRALSEGLVLFALGWAIRGSYGFSILSVILAGLVQPIMAFPGVASLVLLQILKQFNIRILMQHKKIFTSAVIVILVAVAIVLIFVLPAMFQTMDAEWLHILLTRVPFIFVSKWPFSAWVDFLLLCAIVSFQIYALEGNSRRILIAIFITSLLGMTVSFILGDVFNFQIFIQAQFWRGLWLLRAVSAAMFPSLIKRVWGQGEMNTDLRIVSLVFLAATFLAGAPSLSLLATLIALFIFIMQVKNLTKFSNITLIINIFTGILTLFVAVQSLMILISIEKLSENNLKLIGGQNIVNYRAAGYFYPIVAMIFIISAQLNSKIKLKIINITQNRAFYLPVAIILLSFGLLFWDQRTPIQKLTDSGNFYKIAIRNNLGPIRRGVWWMADPVGPWFYVGVPTWQNPLQGTAGVFSRPLALQWYRRTSALVRSGLATQIDLNPWLEPVGNPESDWLLPSKDRLVSGIKSICSQDDNPDVIVVPFDLRKNFPAGAYDVLHIAPPRVLVTGKPETSTISNFDIYTFVHCDPVRLK